MHKYSTVSEFVESFDGTDQGAIVAALRTSILADPRILEVLKWNSPSYMFGGTDCFTIAVRGSKPVLLVLHSGVSTREVKGAAPVVNDPTGLLDWRSDIRATISFASVTDVHDRIDSLGVILRLWVAAL